MIVSEVTAIRGRRPPGAVWLLVGVALLAASVVVYWRIIAIYPALWTHTDEWVYRAAGALIRRHPAALYHRRMGSPGHSKLPFTYPPFAALAFALGSPVRFSIWQIALVVLDVILLPVITYASLRISGQRGPRGAAVALVLAAVALWLEPVYMTMNFGQINLILLALIIVDLALPDSSPWKGIGIGIAGGVKLTPLIFIPYLLATRRVRAGLVGLLSFAATVGIGFAVLPAASLDYWGGRFTQPGDLPNRVQNQSINGMMLRLIPGSTAAHAAWLALAIVVVVAGLATAVAASRRGLELLGIMLCAVTGLLDSPISWSHHWVWVVPALALMAAGARRGGAAGQTPAVRPRDWAGRGLGAGAILAVFAMWPAPVGRLGRATHLLLPIGSLRLAINDTGHGYLGHAWYFLLHNLYVVAGLAAIAGAAAYLWATRARASLARPPAPQTAGDQAVPVPQQHLFSARPRRTPGARRGHRGRVVPGERP